MSEAEVCLFPECSRQRRARGLCSSHYEQFSRLKLRGRADEEDLIERGLLLPSKHGAIPAVFTKGSKVLGDAAKTK